MSARRIIAPLDESLSSERHVRPSKASLLDELEEAHAGLLEGIEELARITGEHSPPEERLTRARWRLSRASLLRRTLWGRILAFLSPEAGPQDSAVLRELQDVDIGLLAASTEHVARWRIESIVENWPGYCEASRQTRSKMIRDMEAEQRLLYPMLAGSRRARAA